MHLEDYLVGLGIGTPEVPVMSVGELKPFSQCPADTRRTLTVELMLWKGSELTRDGRWADLETETETMWPIRRMTPDWPTA